MAKFLELLQDYSVDLCLHGSMLENTAAANEGADGSGPSGQSKRRDKKDSLSGSRLYHSHSVVSAITGGKQLLLTVKGKPMAHVQKPPQVTLSKGDNSGNTGGLEFPIANINKCASSSPISSPYLLPLSPPPISFPSLLAAWILELLALPTEFVSKRLKELRSVFQYSFQHAPCLKFSTKGPLTLKDLQQLAPSQSESSKCSFDDLTHLTYTTPSHTHSHTMPTQLL